LVMQKRGCGYKPIWITLVPFKDGKTDFIRFYHYLSQY
jgi:hypothetical protein